MKYVKVVSVEVPRGGGREIGMSMGVVSADGHTSTLAWLSGMNPWGFHQDLRFSAPLSSVRQGLRIIEATEKAGSVGASHIELHDDDHALLVQAVNQPMRHQHTIPLMPELIRAIVQGGLVDAILNASSEKSE